jgi:hypothetical protein
LYQTDLKINYLDKLKSQTRWDNIPQEPDAFRLLCNQPVCSLSCANIRNGKLAITSIHGSERHSYILSKKDMAFLTAVFLSHLSKTELETFNKIFKSISDESNELILDFEEI